LQGGRSNDDLLAWVNGLFLNSIKTVIGQLCVTEQKSVLQLLPMQDQIGKKLLEVAPDLNAIGCRITQIGQFSLNLSDTDTSRLKTAQSELGTAKRAAKVAQIGISEAEALARQKQLELDQKFQNDARYVQNLAGNYTNYAAGQAMIGAGAGMANGGGEGGGAMTGGAALGVGFGMAQAMGQALAGGGAAPAPAQGGGQAAPAKVSCPFCKASVASGRFCAECGQGLAPKPRFCASCGAEGGPTARFCQGCGTAYPA